MFPLINEFVSVFSLQDFRHIWVQEVSISLKFRLPTHHVRTYKWKAPFLILNFETC